MRTGVATGVPPAARPERPDLGPPVERRIAFDMVKRGLPVLPVLVVLSGAAAGWAGVASSMFAVAVVVVNFLVAALMLSKAAEVSLGLLAAAALGGYLLRLALITVAVLAVHSADWFSPWPFGVTLIVTHLGLLVWESRFVSTSLAFPGLKPPRNGPPPTKPKRGVAS